jgi:peroxiredoxin
MVLKWLLVVFSIKRKKEKIMKSLRLTLGLLLFLAGSARAQAATVGQPAPAFSAADLAGKTVSLSKFKGKYVVLEWHNPDCPFVKSQYKGKMQKLQKKWTDEKVIWLSINSSAPGLEGSMNAEEAAADVKDNQSNATDSILDPSGKIGHAYGAKSTPHMFVIDPKGILIYNGAIDNAPLEDEASDKTQDGAAYINYVDQALTQAASGQKVSVPSTAPYGCGVKYAD